MKYRLHLQAYTSYRHRPCDCGNYGANGGSKETQPRPPHLTPCWLDLSIQVKPRDRVFGGI